MSSLLCFLALAPRAAVAEDRPLEARYLELLLSAAHATADRGNTADAILSRSELLVQTAEALVALPGPDEVEWCEALRTKRAVLYQRAGVEPGPVRGPCAEGQPEPPPEDPGVWVARLGERIRSVGEQAEGLQAGCEAAQRIGEQLPILAEAVEEGPDDVYALRDVAAVLDGMEAELEECR